MWSATVVVNQLSAKIPLSALHRNLAGQLSFTAQPHLQLRNTR